MRVVASPWHLQHKTLQHTATHCTVLQHTALHWEANTVTAFLKNCWVQWRGAVSYQNTFFLQHTATHFNTPQHTATHCNTLQHSATDLEARTVTALLNTVARSSQLREHLLPDTRQKLLNYLLEATKIGHPFMTHIWDTYIGYRRTLFPRHALEMTDLPSRGHQKQARSYSIWMHNEGTLIFDMNDTMNAQWMHNECTMNAQWMHNTLQHTATDRDTPQHSATHCNKISHALIWHTCSTSI